MGGGAGEGQGEGQGRGRGGRMVEVGCKRGTYLGRGSECKRSVLN